MPDAKARILIVDDELSIRTSMSHVLTDLGYDVRTAADGFSALLEIRRDIPQILISDLNMPGMSGFELLRVVRRRFRSIQVIAMSGAFSGDEVPSGVAADAFYQKGSSVGSLLKVMESLPWPERISSNPPAAPEPIWVQASGYDASGESYVTIACPECLKTFRQVLDNTTSEIHETSCIHCRSLIQYAIVRPAVREAQLPIERNHPSGLPALYGMQRLTS